MLSPEDIDRLTIGAVTISARLHRSILKKIAERIIVRINDKGAFLSATDKWQIKVLEDAGMLAKDIQEEIAKATPLQAEEVRRIFREAGVLTDKYDLPIYNAAGLFPEEAKESPAMMRALERGYEATMGSFENLTKTTANAAQEAFIQQCDATYNLVNSGALSPDEAIIDAVNNLAKNGIRTVVYTNGEGGTVSRVDTIETATARAVRTGVGQTTAEMTVKRMEEMQWDLVLVTAHMGARCYGEGPMNHASWQGKKYSLKGLTPGYALLSEATGYGTGEGLCGWNCRHSFGPTTEKAKNPYEGLIDAEENKKAYDNSQKARAMERAIRRTMQELAVWKETAKSAEGDAKTKAMEKVKKLKEKLTRQNTEYEAFCQENNIAMQDWRREIGRV